MALNTGWLSPFFDNMWESVVIVEPSGYGVKYGVVEPVFRQYVGKRSMGASENPRSNKLPFN